MLNILIVIARLMKILKPKIIKNSMKLQLTIFQKK